MELKLTSGYDGTPTAIPRINPDDGFCTLGVYIVANGSVDEAKRRLQHISLEYATAITGNTFTHQAALWSYILYFVPKFAYSAPVLTLTEDECNLLQSAAIMVLLPKLHLNWHTSRTIIFSPAVVGGLALPTLYGLQAYGQLRYFLGHIQLYDTTGHLILVSLAYLQLLSGVDHPILQEHIKRYKKWLDAGWLTALWAFLSKTSISLWVPKAWCPRPPRKNDLVLIDQFVSLRFSVSELSALNRYRVYFKVIHLSDIVSVNGTEISQEYKSGDILKCWQSFLKWPNQIKPPVTAWTLWRNALHHFENSTKLLIPLQQWRYPSHQQW